MSLRNDLSRLGIPLPAGRDLGGRLHAALLTRAGRSVTLSLDTQDTAVLTLARQAGLFLSPSAGADLGGCLETACNVRLAMEAEEKEARPDRRAAQSLAMLYADLWTLLEKAGGVPEEEIDHAGDELEGSGWAVTKQGSKWVAVPDEAGGVRLSFDLFLAETADVWTPYEGPRGGKGWKNTQTGKIVYGAGRPGSRPEVQQRISEGLARKSQERRARGNVNVEELEARLKKHRHTAESQYARRYGLGPGWESRVFNGLRRHHGELTLHRIEELANVVEGALKNLDPGEAGVARQLKQRLAAYGRMIDLARKHGITGIVEPRGTDGGGAGGITPTAEIRTARPELTRPADTGLVPESLHQHLTEHQLQGAAKAIEAMDKVGGFLLADGAGVGKSRQLLAAAHAYAQRGKKVLLVSPANIIKPDWSKNAISGSIGKDGAAMGVGLTLNKGGNPLTPGQVQVTTYEQLGKIKDHIDKDTIVLYDEAHGLKNAESQRSRHGAEIASKAGASLYATATPADQTADLAYLFRAHIEPPPWAETIKRLKPGRNGSAADAYKATNEVFEKLTEKGVMVKREIALDNVEAHFDHVALSPEARAALKQVETEAGGSPKARAQVLMKQRFLQEEHKIPHAVKAAQEELGQGRQVVLFVAGVGGEGGTEEGGEGSPKLATGGNAAKLRAALVAAGVPAEHIAELHGGEGSTGKDAVSGFQSGQHKILITTAQSGGTGHNLDDTTGNAPRTQIVVTAPFSAIDNAQMWGRTHRLTTRSKSRMRYLFADTDVDRWNASLIRDKVATLGAVVAGETAKQNIPEFGGGGSGGAPASAPIPEPSVQAAAPEPIAAPAAEPMKAAAQVTPPSGRKTSTFGGKSGYGEGGGATVEVPHYSRKEDARHHADSEKLFTAVRDVEKSVERTGELDMKRAYEAARKVSPNLSLEDFHRQLLAWANDDKINLRANNDPRLVPVDELASSMVIPRGSSDVPTPYSWLVTRDKGGTSRPFEQSAPAAAGAPTPAHADVAKEIKHLMSNPGRFGYKDYVSLADLKVRLPDLPLEDFHQRLQDMRHAGAVELQELEGRFGVQPEEAEASILEPRGNYGLKAKLGSLVIRDKDLFQKYLQA